MKLNLKNEPVGIGTLALGVLLLAPKLGYTIPPELGVALQGLALSMAGIVLRSNVKGPVTAKHVG